MSNQTIYNDSEPTQSIPYSYSQTPKPVSNLQHDDGTGIDFPTLIDEIAEELSTDKLVVKELSFIINDKAKRSEIEHLDVKGLLNFMHEKEFISQHNTDMLEQYANSIDNATIVKKIKDFRQNLSNTTPASNSTANYEQKTMLTNIVPTHTPNASEDKQQSINSYADTYNHKQPQHYQTRPNEYNSSSFNMSEGNNNDSSPINQKQIQICAPQAQPNDLPPPPIVYPTPEMQAQKTNKVKSDYNTVKSIITKRARKEIFEYPMHIGKTHGVCLIINNVTFKSPHLNHRTGSAIDAANLNRVFTKLNYIVDIHNDLSVDKMALVAEKYSKEVKHTDYDSFVCCILTHGSNDDTLYGTDGREIKLNHILQMFRTSQCQSLSGKPKIFIIQACRGDKEDVGGYQEISSDPTSPDIEKNKFPQQFVLESKITIDLPDMSDFLVAYTTAPGYVSWRSKSEGTWYIFELCDLLTTNHKEYDLMTILTEVNNRIARKKTSQGFKQMPAPVTYLRGSIYIP